MHMPNPNCAELNVGLEPSQVTENGSVGTKYDAICNGYNTPTVRDDYCADSVVRHKRNTHY